MITNQFLSGTILQWPLGPPVVLWILPRCVVKFQPATTQRIWHGRIILPWLTVDNPWVKRSSPKFIQIPSALCGCLGIYPSTQEDDQTRIFVMFFPTKNGGLQPWVAHTLLERQAWAPVLILFLLQICLAADAWAMDSEWMTSISIDIPLEIHYWKSYLWIFSSLVFIDNIGIYANFWIYISPRIGIFMILHTLGLGWISCL